MHRYIREKNVYEIHQMYETSFRIISERLFKDSPWPSVDAVASYVDNDHVFCLLYREMWYRHLYARVSPTPEQRIDSWDNYCRLFQGVVQGVVNMQLPNQWLWDMVDEFVNQFQSFCHYRAEMENKTEQEIALLQQYDQAWNVYGVLNFLQALVVKSKIIQILEQEEEGLVQFNATDGYDYSGGSNVLKVLGYFSMIGLLRVHCLLGDYHTALNCIVPIDITQQGVYTSVIGSHISTRYHHGFANLMLRRYEEAIREFNKVLHYIFKTKQYHQKSPQYEQILKKNEQMYALLAISLTLCPQRKLVEDTVNSQLLEKYGDKMSRMQGYDDDVASTLYDELFSYACPKFIRMHGYNDDEAFTFSYTRTEFNAYEEFLINEIQNGVKEPWVLLLLFVVISELFLGFFVYSARGVRCDLSFVCLSAAGCALGILFAMAVKYLRLLEEINNSILGHIEYYCFKRLVVVIYLVLCILAFIATLVVSCSKPCYHSV